MSLPPLPAKASTERFSREEVQAYARLAAREALERAHETVRNLSVPGGQVHLRQASLDSIRAIAKEYEG